MISLFKKIIEVIAEEADKELNDPVSIKNKLFELEKSLNRGEISEEEYDEIESELLDRLLQ